MTLEFRAMGLPVQYYFSEGRGANRARNKGAKIAEGRYLLFLDDDTELPDWDFLKRIRDRVVGHRTEVALGGFYLSPQGSSLPARVYNCAANLWMMKASKSPHRRPVMVGGCTLIDRQIFWGVGGFEESQEGAAEELALSQRIQARGHKVVLSPQISVHHYFQGGWTRLYGNAFRHGQAKPANQNQRLDSISSRQVLSLLRRGRAIDRRLGESALARLLIPSLAAYYFVVLTGSTVGKWLGRRSNAQDGYLEAVGSQSHPDL